MRRWIHQSVCCIHPLIKGRIHPFSMYTSHLCPSHAYTHTHLQLKRELIPLLDEQRPKTAMVELVTCLTGSGMEVFLGNA
jgi:hypothetical protein